MSLIVPAVVVLQARRWSAATAPMAGETARRPLPASVVA